METDYSFLCSIHLVPLLQAVRDNPNSSKSDVYLYTGGASGPKSRELARLIETGLVHVDESPRLCNARRLYITESGLRLLEAIEFAMGAKR